MQLVQLVPSRTGHLPWMLLQELLTIRTAHHQMLVLALQVLTSHQTNHWLQVSMSLVPQVQSQRVHHQKVLVVLL